MAKITVTLTASYDDGKTTMLPGETVKIEEKEATRLADLGMVVLPDKSPKEQAAQKTTKKASKAKGEKAPAKDDAASPESADDDPFTVDPDSMDLDALDPDAMGDEEGV